MADSDTALPGRFCPFCGQAAARLYHVVNGVRIVRCRRCALLYRQDMPSDLGKLYQEAYYRAEDTDQERWAGSGDYIKDHDRLLRVFDEHIADLERLERPGSLLDVGCALGFLLEAARRRGWSVTGSDISAFAAQYAQREFGITVHVGTIDSVNLPEAAFDVVTAFEFIEHVPDPRSALERLRKCLREGGLLVLTTPNAGSWRARLRPARFPGFCDQTHLTFFTAGTLKRFLSEAGFETVEIRSEVSVVTASTLAHLGVHNSGQLRAWTNRVMPNFKRGVRRLLGRMLGGNGMKIYARAV